MSRPPDALVMGGGSAGCEAASALAEAGWQVTVAEPGGLGGTCLWTGCVPKKSLFVSASSWRAMGRGSTFGASPGARVLDWSAAMAWKRRSMTEVAGDQEGLLASHGIEHVRAAARFVSPTEVALGKDVRRPDAVIIATGARTILPDLPGIELADTSGTALSYETLPASLTIVGAGYIGMEFAATYAMLGVEVTLLARGDRLLPMFDAELAAVAAAHLDAAGVDVRVHTSVTGFGGERGSVLTNCTRADGAPFQLKSERVLVAVGRRPNTDRLGLDAAGIGTDDRGKLVLTDAQQTTNPAVWACGDAAGTIQLKPASELAGRLVARSIITGEPQPISYRSVPSTVFTLPELAQVGLTEAEARRQGIDCRVSRQVYRNLPAAIIDDERDGVVKLVFSEEDGRLLGGAVAGPAASELIYACALGVQARATEQDMRDTVGIHAAYSEGLNFAALGRA